MVFTSSRILSCGVWLMLMRKTSAPASNSLRIIALSEEAGPSVARILIRRSRLMVCFRVVRLAADQTRPEALRPAAGWAGPASPRDFLDPRRPAFPVLSAAVVRWLRLAGRSMHAARRYRPRRS